MADQSGASSSQSDPHGTQNTGLQYYSSADWDNPTWGAYTDKYPMSMLTSPTDQTDVHASREDKKARVTYEVSRDEFESMLSSDICHRYDLWKKKKRPSKKTEVFDGAFGDFLKSTAVCDQLSLQWYSKIGSYGVNCDVALGVSIAPQGVSTLGYEEFALIIQELYSQRSFKVPITTFCDEQYDPPWIFMLQTGSEISAPMPKPPAAKHTKSGRKLRK